MSKDKVVKKCARCDKTIEGTWLTALGKTWHPDHFTCEKCKIPITENQFKVADQKPYCTNCFLEMNGKRCKKCDVLIDGCKEKCVMALGAHWHSEHFSCESCQKTLEKMPFFEKNNEPYCKQCYEHLFCPKCKGCKKPISDTILTALDSQWHQNCFKCSKCKQPIGNGSFGINSEGQPLCEACLK
ncbi:transforming growth factor beta-1-induced transcript 1 protein-like [Cimex lectularius]|uniref:LIM zinc-binding domain-containing protein n=1 Tax=Cimex lectularius TaxID=79782 RepID=A0A8I6SIT3_CIMLE|nr:transforming growth factor beta-1-induced transcript 1 protein-like [Cimex lectularius]XP_024082664.1 transforming growth factor beta-1-induced transcript 1 protein-like [Cimex lectularius]